MRAALAWSVAVLTGCAFDGGGLPNGATYDAEPGLSESMPDPPDATPGCLPSGSTFAFTVANVDVCELPASMGDFHFPDTVKNQIDTETNTIRSGGVVVTTLAHALIVEPGTSQEVMVVVADDLTIDDGAALGVVGSRPLILIAMKTLRVDGTIDASGTAELGGAGSDLACTTGAGHAGATQLGNQTVPIAGGSGGGGGGYGTDGGTGGRVSPQTTPDPPTPGGASWGSSLVPFVGGCRGGDGGVSTVTNTAAAGGGGGGALELVARTEVRIDGVVTVSGGGGRGAGVSTVIEFGGGGGGGGSGGTLLIQSPMVRVMSGKLTSNGGAGGEGRSDLAEGSPGGDGSPDDDTVAIGGDGVQGGNGGNGGALPADATDGTVGTGGATSTAGGGGGGGAVGRIVIRATTVSVMGSDVVSPNAVTLPL